MGSPGFRCFREDLGKSFRGTNFQDRGPVYEAIFTEDKGDWLAQAVCLGLSRGGEHRQQRGLSYVWQQKVSTANSS